MWIAYVVGALILLVFHYPVSCATERAITCSSRMHALLTARYPGDYFDQFHEAQRIQVSDVDNSEKEEALREAGIVNPNAFSRKISTASMDPTQAAFDNQLYLQRTQSQDALSPAQRKSSWQV